MTAPSWSHSDLDPIAAALAAGGVLLLPTDTIYGLHGKATDAAAVAKIAEMKGREGEKPFVVLAASLEQVEGLGAVLGDDVRTLLAAVWPAPVTAIVPLREPIAASRGASTIAVRVPALDWLRELLVRTGPLVSTSANRSGEPPIRTPSELARALQEQLAGTVDAGPLTGEASAIVDFTADPPRVVRGSETLFTQKVWKSLWKWL
jgi:L-threonylcarbamoyladenylate synthase